MGVPALAESVAMIASYLAVEKDLGRIAADAWVIGPGHLLFAGREGARRFSVPATEKDVRRDGPQA